MWLTATHHLSFHSLNPSLNDPPTSLFGFSTLCKNRGRQSISGRWLCSLRVLEEKWKRSLLASNDGLAISWAFGLSDVLPFTSQLLRDKLFNVILIIFCKKRQFSSFSVALISSSTRSHSQRLHEKCYFGSLCFKILWNFEMESFVRILCEPSLR